MKTRIIRTDVHGSPEFEALSLEARYLVLLLMTTDRIGHTGIFAFTDKAMAFHLGTNIQKIQALKKEIEKTCLCSFYNGFVYVSNKFVVSPSGEKNEKAYKNERALIPQDILAFFEKMDTVSIEYPEVPDTPINHKSEIINHKLIEEGGVGETKSTLDSVNDPTVFQEIADHYRVPISFVESKYEDLVNYTKGNGKKYKDYLATLRNWVKRDAEKLRKEHFYANGKPKVVHL